MTRIRIGIGVFSGIALAMSLYLMWHGRAPHDSLPGCGGTDFCDDVISSRWGQLAGLPISVFGAACYFGMITLVLLDAGTKEGKMKDALWNIMVIMSLTGAGFILWLIGLQWLVIKHFCIYCLTTHVFGAVAFCLALRYAPVWRAGPRAAYRLGTPAAVMLVAMISVHILAFPDATLAQSSDDIEFAAHSEQDDERGSGSFQLGRVEHSRTVSLLDGNLHFDVYQVPLIGPADAEHVILDLYDYCCPACRKVHDKLVEFENRYAGRIAFVPLPVPMESDCNPDIQNTLATFKGACTYARYAMAVRRADAQHFVTYHNWLMTGRIPPAIDQARAKAIELVGEDAFVSALQDPRVDEWISDGMSIYRFIQGTTLPKLLAGNAIISTSGLAKRKLFAELEEALGLAAPGTE